MIQKAHMVVTYEIQLHIAQWLREEIAWKCFGSCFQVLMDKQQWMDDRWQSLFIP